MITAQRSRAAPFAPSSYAQPWKSALSNQLKHAKNENQRTEKNQLDTSATATHTAIELRDESPGHDPGQAVHHPARSPSRNLRTNEVIQKHLRHQTQLEVKRQQQETQEHGNVLAHPNYPSAVVFSSVSENTEPGTTSGNSATSSNFNSDQPPQTILLETGAPRPREPPILLLLRRKQAHHRQQSQPSIPHQRKNSCIAATMTQPKQAHTLFFQNAGGDRESSVEICSVAEPSIASPTFDTESVMDNVEGEESTQNGNSPGKKYPEDSLRRDISRKFSDERSGDDSSFRGTGMPERIGKLSRQEDEFDFAILLKPSKYEEHVDLPGTAEAALKSTVTLKPIIKVDPSNIRAVIVSRIKRTGLHVKRLFSLDGKQSLLKVRAPQRVLELGAERLRLRKQRRFDQLWMVFSCELRSSFADFDPVRKCINFLDSEKQSIVHALLTASETEGGAGLNEFCPIATRYVLQMYPLHKQDLALLKTRWVTFLEDIITFKQASARFSAKLPFKMLDTSRHTPATA